MRARPKAMVRPLPMVAMERKGQVSRGLVEVGEGSRECRECGNQSGHQIDI